jgi:predicted ester cyclase
MTNGQLQEPTGQQLRNLETVRRVLKEFWQEGHLEVADEVFTKDFVRHDPNNMDVHGPEGYKRLVAKTRKAFPDLKVDIKNLMPYRNLVEFRVIVSGTHLGDFVGIKPTGAKCAIGTNTEVHFNKDGMVTEGYVQSDYLGLIRDIIRAMSWWQFLINLPALLTQADFGRSPDSEFGERGPYRWYRPRKKTTK